MELEPVAIRSGVYSPCRFESYTLRLRNIYIKQKTRNLTRIPIFAMIEVRIMTSCLCCGMLILGSEVNMCPYCKYLFTQIPGRNIPENQPDKVETAIFENVVFNKGEGRKNV